ncbi:MAG: HAD-IIB family hydrolase, partial [Bacillus sp. (in: firmicutes)]
MPDYQILFLDIDGTILRPDHSIEASTKIAITEMKRKGIEVVLATGRPLHELQELATELEVNSFISYNGSYAVYNGQEVFKKHIDSTVIENYIAIASQHHHDLILYSST